MTTTLSPLSGEMPASGGVQPTFDAMRTAMVSSQLRTSAVSDQRVIAAMARVPREAFVPADRQGLAYRDAALPLGNGRAMNLPLATGRLLTEASLLPADRVLLIGAATGYTATLLSEIVGHVTAVESDEALLGVAATMLAGLPNVVLVAAPLTVGAPDTGPYDVLVVDGAIEALPDALLAQVRSGGRVVSGLLDRGVTRLASGARTEGGFALQPFADSECAVLPGFGQPRGFQFAK